MTRLTQPPSTTRTTFHSDLPTTLNMLRAEPHFSPRNTSSSVPLSKKRTYRDTGVARNTIISGDPLTPSHSTSLTTTLLPSRLDTLVSTSSNTTSHCSLVLAHGTSNRPRMTAQVCSKCITGSLDEGTPKGQDTHIAGVPCYITQPTDAQKPGKPAIILATDIFGWQLINARLIADAFAEAGYTTVIPDYFKGDPVNIKLLELYESLPTLNIFSKVVTVLQLVVQALKLGSWLKKHPFKEGTDVVTAVAAELREKHGATKVGLQGYCYGGTVGILMSSKAGVLDAVCSAHPGSVKLPDDVQDISTPILFICAESDAQFPEKTRTAVQQLLEDKSPGLSTFILYPGTQHGFAVRGNKHKPVVNAAREDALKQGLAFFGQHLAGIAPPPTQLDAAASPPVGKRIVLAPRAC